MLYWSEFVLLLVSYDKSIVFFALHNAVKWGYLRKPVWDSKSDNNK